MIRKKRSKGKEIRYSELKIEEYLLPGYENIAIEEQRNIFAIRNRMVEVIIFKKNKKNKLGLSCAKLSTALVSYPLAVSLC